MKRTVMFILSLVLSYGIATAQDDFGTEARRPTHSIEMSKPIEINIMYNGWHLTGGPQTDPLLTATLASLANGEYRIPLSSSLQKLLEESRNRDQAASSRWIHKDSPRLQEQTLVWGELAWEVTTGGESSGSNTGNYGANGYRVSTESGAVSACITVTLRDLVSGIALSTIVGHGSDKNPNITSIDTGWFQRNGLRFNMSSWNSDPMYRRAMVATKNALEDLRKKIPQLYTPEEVRH